MTDRYIGLTVVLKHEIREDDAQPIIDAIRMIKGVHDVVPQVAGPGDYIARSVAYDALVTKLLAAIRSEKP